jgi:hypothetical protein
MSVEAELWLRMEMIEARCPKRSLDQIVRERAYLLWEKDGCPHGCAEEYWHRAHDQRLRERAYVLGNRKAALKACAPQIQRCTASR